ncbi:MAG: hypothetical protein LBQ24_01160 [Candidatus Peribacteria bacterium]|jgi:hypothetical protein|nr:hypothetical protein [Candidatus Peribacteria bacterium]
MYRNFTPSSSLEISFKIFCLSKLEIVEFISSALSQSSFNLSTWSFISEIRGEITTTSHSKITQGN